MGMFSDQIPDCPMLFAFVDELPDEIRARLTRYPFVDGRFAAWLPMVFDCDEAREAARALIRADAMLSEGEEGLAGEPQGLEEYLALCFLALTLLEDHDDLRVDGLRRVVACGARDARDGATPFEAEVHARAMEGSEDGVELQKALDAFMESCGYSERAEAMRAAGRLVEKLAADVEV